MARGRPTKLTLELARKIMEVQRDREKRGLKWLTAPAMRKLILRRYEDSLRKQKMSEEDIRIRLEIAKKTYPGESAIQKFMAKMKLDSLLDQPWRISTLPQYEIPPQSLPKVLELFIEKLREQAVHITIREAQWIGRLAFVLKDKEILWVQAINSAWSEQVLEATGLDYTDIGDDALLYGDMTGKFPLGDDFTDIREKEASAQVKQKRMEIKGRKNEAENVNTPKVVAHLNGVQIYPKEAQHERVNQRKE